MLGIRSKTAHGPRSRFKRSSDHDNSSPSRNEDEKRIHYVFGKNILCKNVINDWNVQNINYLFSDF